MDVLAVAVLGLLVVLNVWLNDRCGINGSNEVCIFFAQEVERIALGEFYRLIYCTWNGSAVFSSVFLKRNTWRIFDIPIASYVKSIRHPIHLFRCIEVEFIAGCHQGFGRIAVVLVTEPTKTRLGAVKRDRIDKFK